jgi:solute:Na+ symporter, SSS family
MIMSAGILPYGAIIVLLALAGVGFAGNWALRANRVNGSVDYFLGGRKVGWWALSGSFFATALWTVWCTGVEMGFRTDVWLWAGLGFAMAAGFALTGLVLVPVFRQAGTFTLPSFIGERAGSPALGTTLSIASVALAGLVRIPLTILLAGRMMQLIFGWDPVTAGLLIIVVPGVFAVAGGYSAVFAVQSGAAVAAVAGLAFFGSTGALDMTLPASAIPGAAFADPMLFAITFVIIGLWTAGVEQSGFQRVNASPTPAAPRRAAAAVAGAMAVAGLAVGVGAASRGTGLGAIDTWTGVAVTFVGTSLLMTAMASLAGQFMSVSTLMTMDVFTRIRHAANESVIVLVGRLMSTVIVVFAILASSLLAFVGDTAVLWLVGAYAVLAPPIMAATLMGLVRTLRHATALFWGLGAGWVTGAALVLHQGERMATLPSLLWTALAGGGAALVVTGVIVLLVTPGTLASLAGAGKDAGVSKL